MALSDFPTDRQPTTGWWCRDADLKFPSPHEVETIPGTIWRMYPYHYQFSTEDPERKKFYEEGMSGPTTGCITQSRCIHLTSSGMRHGSGAVTAQQPHFHCSAGYGSITVLSMDTSTSHPARRTRRRYQARRKLYERAGILPKLEGSQKSWEEKMRNVIGQLVDPRLDPARNGRRIGCSKERHILRYKPLTYDKLIDLGILAGNIILSS
jgi:hypothetical protein